jgi:hypothetical protein
MEDRTAGMVVALGLLSNFLLIAGAWLLAGHGLGVVARIDRFLATGVIAFAWCVLGIEILGTAGWISGGPILCVSGALFALGLITKQVKPHGAIPTQGRAEAEAPWGASAIACAALALWPCVILFMQSLLMPVKVVSDAPIYHLYFAIRWWKAGRLFLVPAPFGENAATYFPANGDLCFTWLVASWGGETLAKVGQGPFLVVALVAAFGIARLLGAGRDSALIASCWFATVTPLLVFTFEANVDTIFVGAYLCSFYFFLRHQLGEGGIVAAALGGLAAGLALGTKPVGLVFVAPLLMLWLVAALLRPGSRAGLLTSCLVALAGATITSAFWFARNLIVTGNPLYPLEVGFLGRTLFPGCYDRAAMRHSIYYLPATDWRALIDILMAVLDPRLALLWVPATLGAWALGARKRTPRDRWVWAIAGMAALNILLYWLVIPYRTQQRFMLQAIGLAVTPLARLLDRGRPWRAAAAALLALHLLAPQTWPVAGREEDIPWDLDPRIPNVVLPLLPFSRLAEIAREPSQRVPSLVGMALYLGIGACSLLTVWSLSRLGAGRGRAVRLALQTAGLAGMLLLGALGTRAIGADARRRFYPAYPDFLEGWLHLEARSGPDGARVAYAGTNIPYYLFGTGLRNEVRYVNIDGHRDWLLHDYQQDARERGEPLWPNSRPGWDRAHPDFDSWLNNLRAERIALLVVTVVNPGEGPHNIADAQRFPIERRWAESHPDLFEPLYGSRERNPFIRIYGLRRPD